VQERNDHLESPRNTPPIIAPTPVSAAVSVAVLPK
jgi:hypothetical protein